MSAQILAIDPSRAALTTAASPGRNICAADIVAWRALDGGAVSAPRGRSEP